MIPELTIVVPTLNERDNIEPLVARLRRVLDGVVWDVVFVDDDSRDGTLEALHSLARQAERASATFSASVAAAYPRPAWRAWRRARRPTSP